MRRGILLATVLLLLALGSEALAQTGGGFDLSWWSVDGGGGASSGGGYSLSGAAGQPDAGTLAGGTYVLTGGFWQAAAAVTPPGYNLYLPLTIRN